MRASSTRRAVFGRNAGAAAAVALSLSLGGCGAGGAGFPFIAPVASGTLPFASLGEVEDAIQAAQRSSDPSERLDTDGDQVPDVVEAVLGTDPTLSDTDHDGLPDGAELFETGWKRSDPLPDHDGDGRIAPLDDDDDGDHVADGTVVDTDGDGVPNALELYGYTFDVLTGHFVAWNGDPAVPHFFTDPLQRSTDQDAYPDGMEVSHALEDPTVRAPGDDPLVPAYPNLVCELVSYQVTLNEDLQVTETESHAKGETWDRKTDQSHSWGVHNTWEVAGEYAFGPTGGAKVSAKYGQTYDNTFSTTTSVGTGGSITTDEGWSSARSVNPTRAAVLKLYLKIHNRGTAPVSHVVPTLALRIGGLNVATFEPSGASVNVLVPGATYPAEPGWLWVVDAKNTGGGSEPLYLRMSELRALERGAPVSLTVTQARGDAMRLSSAGAWESLGDTNEFTARCDAVCANLRIELEDGTLVHHLVYAGEGPSAPVMTLRAALAKLGVDSANALHCFSADGVPHVRSLDGFAMAIDAATLRANGWTLAADDPTGSTDTAAPPGFVVDALRLLPDSVVYVRAPRPVGEPPEPTVHFATLDPDTGEISVSCADYRGITRVVVHNQYDPAEDVYREQRLAETVAGAGFYTGDARGPAGFDASDVLTAVVENLDGLVSTRDLGSLFVAPGPQRPVIHTATLDLDELRVYANVESGNADNPNSNIQWIRAFHPDFAGGFVDLHQVYDFYRDPYGFEAPLPANFGNVNKQDVEVVAYVVQGVQEIADLSFADAAAVAVRHNSTVTLRAFVDRDHYEYVVYSTDYVNWQSPRIDFDAAAASSGTSAPSSGFKKMPVSAPAMPGAPTDVMLQYDAPSSFAWARIYFNAEYKKLAVGGLSTYQSLTRDEIVGMAVDVNSRTAMKLGTGGDLKAGDVLAMRSTSGRAAKVYVESVTYDHNVLKFQWWADVKLRFVVFE